MANSTQIEWTDFHLEPSYGLFQDYDWLRFLLRRAVFRALPRRRRASV